MSNSILKNTECNLFCGFKNITSYCLDCPALMCSKCKISMHSSMISKKHIIIDFENISLNWDDKELITDMFEDKTLAEGVFNEVNRRPAMFSKPDMPDSPLNEDLPGKWRCDKCTYDNLATTNKCKMCHACRTTGNDDNDYDSKIEVFQKDMLLNFVELDNIYAVKPELPFEHVMYCYTHGRVANVTLDKWYNLYYPDRKSLSFVNCIIEENGYTIRTIDLERKYNILVKDNNDTFLTFISDPKIKEELSRRSEFLEPNDMNKLNTIPDYILNQTPTEEELWNLIIKEDSYTDHEIRKLIVELHLDSQVYIDILRMFLSNPELGNYVKGSCPKGNVKLHHIKQAITDYISVKEALNFLRRTCEICCSEFPIPEMRGLITCQHEYCKNCLLEWLKVAIEEKYPCQWNCPSCDENEYLKIDKHMYYSQLRRVLAEDTCTLNIFELKLLEDQLRKSPNFHNCANDKCINGFEAEGINKIECPSCHGYMCAHCNRVWKPEHEGKTCKEFVLWMLKNDKDVSNLLKDIGIECPGCKMRYSLAAGGCLHFECKVCKMKFCGGCYQNMFDGKCNNVKCTLSSLHSHHPRNCLYFLRDRSANELEAMLKTADYPKLQGKPEKNCKLILTEKTSFKEYPCNVEVHATTGLCEAHYKEYLVQFINRYEIDPAEFADSGSLNLMLFQMIQPQLEKAKNENDAQFKERLKKTVKDNCLFYIPKGVDQVQLAGQ